VLLLAKTAVETLRDRFLAMIEVSGIVIRVVSGGLLGAFGIFKTFLGGVASTIGFLVTNMFNLIDAARRVADALGNIKLPKLKVPGDTGGNPLIPGPLAKGGPANAGNLYLVGEEGPELFVPRSSGVVIPNNKLTSGSGSPLAGAGSGITFTGDVILNDAVDVELLTRKLSFAQMAGAL
jgi:hypothetical protein